MQPGISATLRVEFRHTAQLAAILCGKTSRVDAEGREIVGPYLRAKAGRPVASERKTVHHELRLILRTAWMQNSVALIQPPWLRVHQILYGATRQRNETVL